MVFNKKVKVLCIAVHGNLITIRDRENKKYMGEDKSNRKETIGNCSALLCSVQGASIKLKSIKRRSK